MDTQTKVILQAWVQSILHHAMFHVPESERRMFITWQFRLLERDFKVRLTLEADWIIEIDYLTDASVL